MNIRIFFTILSLILGMGHAYADDGLTVRNVAVARNGQAMLAIETAFESDVFYGYQLEVRLPKGIAITLNNEDKPMAVTYTDLGIVGSVLSSTSEYTSYQFVASAMGNPRIPAGNYVLFAMPIESDGTLEVGTVLDCSVTNILFSDGTQTGKTMADQTFKVTISDKVVLDENSPVAPTQQSGVNVLVKRTIKKDTWNTIVLPFALAKTKVTNIFGSDVELYEFTGFETDYGEDETNMTPLGIKINLKSYTVPRNGIPSGKPLFIRVSKDIESFEVDAVNINPTVNDAVKDDEVNGLSGKLTGSFMMTKIPMDGLFISNDQFWYSVGKTNIKAFRCWFELGAVLNKETDFASRIILSFDESDVTDIKSINSQVGKDNYFNLSGQQVKNPVKGIYVKDGKKVIFK